MTVKAGEHEVDWNRRFYRLVKKESPGKALWGEM